MTEIAPTDYDYVLHWMILPFFVYIIEGLLIFILNMLYFVGIIKTHRLREKYGLMGMEFFAGGTMGLAVFLAGITRLIRVLFNDHYTPTSKRFCMILPFNAILSWSDPMTAVSMLMVSIDRLISIVQPVKYYKNMISIQKNLALYSNLSILPLILGSAICSYRSNITVDGICWTPDTRCPIFNQLYYGIRITAAAASVVLYIIALFVVRKKIRRIQKHLAFPCAVAADKRQIKFTTTAGFSCFATVGLYVLPMIAAFLEIGHEKLSDVIYTTIIIISNLNSVPKIIIVGWRSTDIREAVFDLIPGIFHR